MNGSALFLTCLGRKTAKDLNLTHRACISVSNIQDAASPPPEDETKSQPKNSSKKGSGKKQKKTGNGKKQAKSKATYETEKKAKDQDAHSVILSELFQEADPIFKAIRQKLNNLTLERRSPKIRRSSSCQKKDKSAFAVVNNLDSFGFGGKAGRSSYTVNVGQVENLYISSNRDFIHCKSCSRQKPSIDLHGYTKVKAIEKLDEALVDWMDTAMKGEYPWVITFEIVCGGGNQIMSETVVAWIKSKLNVANAPKGQSL